MANEKGERSQVRVSPDIGREIKVAAALQDRTMGELVDDLWRAAHPLGVPPRASPVDARTIDAVVALVTQPMPEDANLVEMVLNRAEYYRSTDVKEP